MEWRSIIAINRIHHAGSLPSHLRFIRLIFRINGHERRNHGRPTPSSPTPPPPPPPFSSDCPRPDGNPCQLLRRELALLSAWIRARQHVITRNCTGEKGRKREKMDEQPRFFVSPVPRRGLKKIPHDGISRASKTLFRGIRIRRFCSLLIGDCWREFVLEHKLRRFLFVSSMILGPGFLSKILLLEEMYIGICFNLSFFVFRLERRITWKFHSVSRIYNPTIFVNEELFQKFS